MNRETRTAFGDVMLGTWIGLFLLLLAGALFKHDYVVAGLVCFALTTGWCAGRRLPSIWRNQHDQTTPR